MNGLTHQEQGVGLCAGQVFAGYTIERFLGSGGMGEVYLAKHPRLPRQEALKILGSDISADDGYRRRFIKEADLAAALWHPNIVRVNDRGEFNGQLWISMDFVDGTDAASLLREQYPAGMPADQVAAIIAAIADALDYAHRDHELMHRDVSPANILLTKPSAGDQRILLSDFGIARNICESSGLTATNMTIGTFPYAAPEQLTDEPIDGRADQYALAATAYHLLTGAPLFPHTNPAVVISRHLTAPPPALAQSRPMLRVFDPVLAIALAKDPGDRFARCTDFAEAFARAADSGRHPTPSASTMPRPLVGRPLKSAVAPAVSPDIHKERAGTRWRIIAAASTAIALTALGASGYRFDNRSTVAQPVPPAPAPSLAQPQHLPEYVPPPAAAQPQVAVEAAPPPAPAPPVAPVPKATPRPASPTAAPVPAAAAPQPPARAPQPPPPAPQPPPPAPDQTFIGLVQQIPGLTVTDPATAASTGRAVCADLRNGGSPDDAAAATVTKGEGITPAQAAAGVNAAITAYCPEVRR
ncbi:protein kinase [Mycobacterium kubicae]|uniref:serine/threonine-protein kinase n=1 Tax=Mycobacterium kubicae TaxID=120959 RepID=UPI00163FD3B1|nr:serine/threonine-protein kinase [Mycobacterium kubicae]QNI08696.1 protein kinase [Mycobacterium kubicae]